MVSANNHAHVGKSVWNTNTVYNTHTYMLCTHTHGNGQAHKNAHACASVSVIDLSRKIDASAIALCAPHAEMSPGRMFFPCGLGSMKAIWNWVKGANDHWTHNHGLDLDSYGNNQIFNHWSGAFPSSEYEKGIRFFVIALCCKQCLHINYIFSLDYGRSAHFPDAWTPSWLQIVPKWSQLLFYLPQSSHIPPARGF